MESTIELEFESERLKRYLIANPQQAAELAVNYFEDFSVLAHEHQQLQAQYQALQHEKNETATKTKIPS